MNNEPSKNWQIFQGTGTPHNDINRLPPPPSWRQFDGLADGATAAKKQQRGATFQARPEEIELVNAALYLRRPLLVTGKPGTGKTSLAYAIAYELQLGEVLRWSITTRTNLNDGLYRYDAIGRLQDAQGKGEDNLEEIGQYIRLGSLGTALLPSDKPRVLLIDEIDKSDIDLPNDLLHIFEEGEFEIPELVRIAGRLEQVEVRTAYTDETEATAKDFKTVISKGRVRCQAFPFVILTNNGERDFPPPFLRRCLRLNMREPNQDELTRIVKAHLGEKVADKAKGLIAHFLKKREQGDLATDQLLNAIYLLTRERIPSGQEKAKLVEQLLKYLSSTED
ncbi:AAA family ATPase [Coleofasciculus sp.]|uniref:AAA family ATPase n=1 Tax=Coleofasciculus sp. TaxID=3100458 RepID=UPI003A30E1B9